ncbi:MAG: FeoA domain-containing protein [Ignavibacteria bacterium]|nr:FeoA domain-containing protein [Ignavibacteria bacterium]
MNDPLTILLIGTTIMVFLMFFFWPKTGVFAIWKNRKSISKRVLIEDSLKHLYNCEYSNINCTLNSIAGSLSIPADDAVQLIARLESMSLITSHEKGLRLTSEGRSYALRIIRVHRLWERYLADETGVDEADWHTVAEEIEHEISQDEADELSAQIGNPVYDPHGDPIPSSGGDLPAKKGRPLNSLRPGEFARIIHVEDEPHAIYTQLLAEGIYPGMQVKMMAITNERIIFIANGEEVVLAPLFAKNITITPIREEVTVKGKFIKLSSLAIGEKGVVLGISKRCRGQQRRRLMDLGLVPGTVVEAEMKSIGGDPVAYRIRGASIAIRKKQADRIFMKEEL